MSRWKFNGLPRIRIRFGPDAPPIELREHMIAHTNRFLSRALAGKRQLPRIPRRRVDRGGFTELSSHPGGKALIEHFWARLLGDR